MWLLRRLGYVGLSLAMALPYLRGERVGRIAILTFDDSYVDTLEHALPVLLHRGFSATCYAVSRAIGQVKTWNVASAGSGLLLMSVDQLMWWHQAGMEIGAQTRSHARLTACTARQLRNEIAGGRQELQQRLGVAVSQFSYPFGEVNDRIAATVREAGFAAAVTARQGRAIVGGDLWQLPRLAVDQPALLPFAAKLLTHHEERRA
ncbi:polysaccharide deacetylase family protein [Dyella koreensis]